MVWDFEKCKKFLARVEGRKDEVRWIRLRRCWMRRIKLCRRLMLRYGQPHKTREFMILIYGPKMGQTSFSATTQDYIPPENRWGAEPQTTPTHLPTPHPHHPPHHYPLPPRGGEPHHPEVLELSTLGWWSTRALHSRVVGCWGSPPRGHGVLGFPPRGAGVLHPGMLAFSTSPGGGWVGGCIV